MKGRLVSAVITKDTVLDFKQLSGGLGIRNLTLYNAGNATLIIDDTTKQELKKGETFCLESHLSLVNTDFRLKFKKDEKKEKKVFVRYIVEIAEQYVIC